MIASIDDKRNIFLFNQETKYLFLKKNFLYVFFFNTKHANDNHN